MTRSRVGSLALLFVLVALTATAGCKKSREQSGNEPNDAITPDQTKNPLANVPDVPKVLKGTTPIGKTPLTELEEPIPVWDYVIRLPKGLHVTVENQKTSEEPNVMYFYQWTPKGVLAGRCQVNVNKWPSTEANPLLRISGGPQKSKPGDQLQFDTIHGPQPVEINGMSGARYWRFFPSLNGHVEVHIVYYFVSDGWGYHFNCFCFGKTEAEAKQAADTADVAVCTFRKK